jgi:hypothetical protein
MRSHSFTYAKVPYTSYPRVDRYFRFVENRLKTDPKHLFLPVAWDLGRTEWRVGSVYVVGVTFEVRSTLVWCWDGSRYLSTGHPCCCFSAAVTIESLSGWGVLRVEGRLDTRGCRSLWRGAPYVTLMSGVSSLSAHWHWPLCSSSQSLYMYYCTMCHERPWDERSRYFVRRQSK